VRTYIQSFGFFEVGVLKDVGRGADQLEADAVTASVTFGEAVTGDHYGFVGGAMIALVKDLVDPGFNDRSAGSENTAIGTALMCP
jgi:hypothetical protein